MGKVTIYQCDICNEQYTLSSQVMSVNGDILNGDDQIVIEGDKNKLICINCLISKLESFREDEIFLSEEKQDIETDEKSPKDLKILKRISNEKEEGEFIRVIGHSSRDSFERVYKGSLIDYYYPVELDDNETINIEEYTKKRSVNVIYKIFASIPQVKKVNVFIHDKKNLAVTDEQIDDE